MSYTTTRSPRQVKREGLGTKLIAVTAKITDIIGGAGANVATCIITNPSTRLHGQVEVFFEPTSEPEPIFSYNASVWDIDAFAKGLNRRMDRLHNVELNENLPRAYEWNTAIKIVRVVATCLVPQTAAAADIDGTWYVRAYFEPNMDFTGDDEELQKLFSEAGLEVIPAV